MANRRILLLTLAAAALAAPIACLVVERGAVRSFAVNAATVRVGMTRAEVESKLGRLTSSYETAAGKVVSYSRVPATMNQLSFVPWVGDLVPDGWTTGRILHVAYGASGAVRAVEHEDHRGLFHLSLRRARFRARAARGVPPLSER